MPIKRRLIDYDVFENIERNSLSSYRTELEAAAPVVAKALGSTQAELKCFGNETALYETIEGNQIYATFNIQDGFVNFENIEELVLNEETELKSRKDITRDLLEALLANKPEVADQKFNEFMHLPITRRTFEEVRKQRVVPIRKTVNGEEKTVGYKKAKWEVNPKHKESTSKTNKRMKSKKKNNKKLTDGQKKMKALKRKAAGHGIHEWVKLVGNLQNYVEFRLMSPTLKETNIKHDDKGNVVGLRIPTKKIVNEAKLLQFDWDTINTDCIIMRKKAKKLSENVSFCNAIADLKKQNALSDNDALMESLEAIVVQFPQVIYLTESELSTVIKESLEFVQATNYDDATCDFMAEGVLRTAYDTYNDKVSDILKLSGSRLAEDSEDPYKEFSSTVTEFYSHLEEASELERQAFVDIYEALREVYEMASEEDNNQVRSETADHLDQLLPILRNETTADLEVMEAASDWLKDLLETNLETQDWNVSNKTHVSINGDHPELANKARKSYSPASDFSGDWGDNAPASDGSSYRGSEAEEMRSNSWGNIGGDTYPELSNPYVPKPFGDYKMKGEKSVADDNDTLAYNGGNDTWPNLKNPVSPSAETPQSYKMNHGKEQDLVVDK